MAPQSTTQSTTHTPAPKTIALGSSSCLQGLLRGIEAVGRHDHALAQSLRDCLRNELDRFTLWTSNIGVFANVNRSLDFRLQEIPDVVELFVDQLEIIGWRLDQLREKLEDPTWGNVKGVGSSPSGPSHGSQLWQARQLVVAMPEEDVEEPPSKPEGLPDEIPDEWTVAELVEATHEGIEWLHRLSSMVRRASLFSQNKRAANFKWRDEEGNPSEEETQRMIDFLKGQYMTFLLDSSPEGSGAAKHRFGAEPAEGHAPGSDTLRDRVIETMTIRHSRVLYRRSRASHSSHSLKQVLPPSMELQVDTAMTPRFQTAKLDQTPEAQSAAAGGQARQTGAAVTERSGATSVDQTWLRQSLTEPAPSRQLSSVPSGQKLREDMPLAPRRAQKGHSFVCSYCCCILSGPEGCGRAWREHIERDLDPYICVFDPCDSPSELYSSRQGWLAHMWSRHRTEWICFSSDHKEPWKSDKPSSFKQHLLECHPKEFRPDQLPTIVEASKSLIRPLFEQCPFCSESRVGDLEDHIVDHLRTFALRSLPSHDDEFGSVATSSNLRTITDSGGQPSSPGVSKTISNSRLPQLLEFLPEWTWDDTWDHNSQQAEDLPDVSNSILQSLDHYRRLGFDRTNGITRATLLHLVHELPVTLGVALYSHFSFWSDTLPVSARASHTMDAISQLEDKHLSAFASKRLSTEQQQSLTARARANRMWKLLSLALRFRAKLRRIFHKMPVQGEVPLLQNPSSTSAPPAILPMASDSPIESLAEQIMKSSRRNWEGEDFLPEDRLQSFTEKSKVRTILEAAKIATKDVEELLDFVCKEDLERSGRRLFFILVMMSEKEREKVSFLKALKDNGVDDSALPIAFYSASEESFNRQGYQLEDPSGGKPSLESKRFPIFAEWDRSDRTNFSFEQWRFLAPVFGLDRFRFRFSRKRIMPYIKISPKPTSSGFFGEVSQAELLAAHAPESLRDPNSDTTFIAIKKAREGEETAKVFDDEVDNLEKIRQYTSDHLVKPIAAYKHGEDKCLVFPWAHGGNLDSYWKNHEAEATDKDSLLWIIGQFAGICSGLQELHESNCRHGDLKPENILWFRDPVGGVRTGNLQIAELALATFHEKETQTKDRIRLNMFTNTPSGTSRYEPPEMDERRGQHEVRSRSYDIWSMGCILLDLLVWLLEGYAALVNFQTTTPVFWAKGYKDGRVWYAVSSLVRTRTETMAARLRGHPGRTNLYQDLLNIVQTRLLVVDCSTEYKSFPGKRETAKALHALIYDIFEKCQQDSPYLTPVRLHEEHSRSGGMSRGTSAALLPVPGIIIRQTTSDIEPTGTSTVSAYQSSDHQEARVLFERQLASDGPSVPDEIKDANELRVYLELERREGGSVADAIYEKLDKNLVPSMMVNRSASGQEFYMPMNHLYDVLDTTTVSSLMKELFPHAARQDLRSKVAHILGAHNGAPRRKGRCRILAMLIFSNRLDALDGFIEGDIWDEDLPLRRREGTDCSTDTNPNHINTTLLNGWTRKDLTLFYDAQSMFNVPFFDLQEDNLRSLEFPPKVRLPWTSFQTVAHGGSSSVYRIEIHPSHHNYDSQEPAAFALKRISSPESETYAMELAAHEKVSAKLQKADHIIKLLATFKLEGDHYLIFEWADGTLDKFWETRVAKESPQTERWAAEQCLGLATGLKQIHGLATWQVEEQNRDTALGPHRAADWGRHGDIKPSNILWFSKYRGRKDHLVISDLGLTRFYSDPSQSIVPSSEINGFTAAYRPPEMDLNLPVSRKSDIWSLGCVFLEFCIWYLQGADGVERFEDDRSKDDDSDIPNFKEYKFFNLGSVPGNEAKTPTIKPIVKEWIANIRASADRSLFVQRMLEIIETKMLIIDAADRQPSDIICVELRSIVDLQKENFKIPT